MTATFADLFCGVGGMRLAFERAGAQCAYACEIDKFARKTYAANFDCCSHQFDWDIAKVDAAAVPRHDVLLAGFPCQPFSAAGIAKRNSLGRPHGLACRTHGTLFHDICRVLAAKRPRAFFLENVPALRTHAQGRTYRIILTALRDLGYDVSDCIACAKSWVPQKRKRLFIAGVRAGGRSFNLRHIPAPNEPVLASILEPDVAAKYTISNKLWNYLRGHAEKHRRAGNGFGYSLVTPAEQARTLSARYGKDGSEILIAQIGKNPRRLTPRECARLMGFPDEFAIPVSDTQAYRQFGNSVVVPAVTQLAEQMVSQE